MSTNIQYKLKEKIKAYIRSENKRSIYKKQK